MWGWVVRMGGRVWGFFCIFKASLQNEPLLTRSFPIKSFYVGTPLYIPSMLCCRISLILSTSMGWYLFFSPYLLSIHPESLGMNQTAQACQRGKRAVGSYFLEFSKYNINRFLLWKKKDNSCFKDPGSVRPWDSDSNIYFRLASCLQGFHHLMYVRRPCS